MKEEQEVVSPIPLTPLETELRTNRKGLERAFSEHDWGDTDAQDQGFVEAKEPEPEPQTTKSIELQPGPAPLPPEIEGELRELRAVAAQQGIVKDPNFIRDFSDPLVRAYFGIVNEMAQYFDADPATIKDRFLDPLTSRNEKNELVYNPRDLPAEWWEQQIGLMTKAPSVIRRKIEAKVANLGVLQENLDNEYKRRTSPEALKAEQEERQRQQVQAQQGHILMVYRGELQQALREREFSQLSELKKRVDQADTVDALRTVDPRLMGYTDTELANGKFMGTAVREALRRIKAEDREAQDRPITPDRKSSTPPAAMFKDPRRSVQDSYASYDWDAKPPKDRYADGYGSLSTRNR